MSEWISTKEAMRILGVGSTTVKRWADDDKIPFVRTAGGHRRFPRSAVERLLRNREVEPSDGAAAHRWVRWLRTKDLNFIKNQITQLHEQLGDWFAVADFLGLVTTEIGRCWADSEFSILDEHIASARLGQALSAVSSSFEIPDKSPVCLLATLSGERHSLGLALAQLCLRSANIEALWVGVDMPAEELIQHIRDIDQDHQMVALSASSWLTDHRSLARDYSFVAAACQERGIELILGGNGAWPDVIEYGYRCHSYQGLERVLRVTELPAHQPIECEP